MIEIHLYKKNEENITEYHLSEVDGTHQLGIEKKLEFNDRATPTLILPEWIFDILCKEISGYMNDRGLKDSKEYRIEGTLAATNEHLKTVQAVNEKLFTLIDKVTPTKK